MLDVDGAGADAGAGDDTASQCSSFLGTSRRRLALGGRIGPSVGQQRAKHSISDVVNTPAFDFLETSEGKELCGSIVSMLLPMPRSVKMCVRLFKSGVGEKVRDPPVLCVCIFTSNKVI